jgi:class 3 adenylate cyclase
MTDKESISLALRAAIAEAVELLESVGEEHWARILREFRFDGFEGERVMVVFGGMGSFTDLIIDPINGHRVHPDRVAEMNLRLRQVRHRIYELAWELSRE